MIRDIQEIVSRLVAVLRRRALDREFDEEFATHVDLLAQEKQRNGLSRVEARRQAVLQMGGRNTARNLHREVRGLPSAERILDTLGAFCGDLCHAARSLLEARGFTFVSVASLGIGMGTVIAILLFTRALGAPAPGIDVQGMVELLVVREGPLRAQAGGWGTEQWSYPDFEAIRDAGTSMEVTGWAMGEASLNRPEESAPLVIPTMFVSAGYFRTLGVTLAMGPGFDPAVDDRGGAELRVVLGYRFWENRLASEPDIVGSTLTLDGVPHVVVGVAPEGFAGHVAMGETAATQLFIPLSAHPRFELDRFDRNVDWVRIHGRLLPGVSIEQADAALAVLMSGLAEEYPSTNEFKAATVEPYFVQGARARPGMSFVRAGLLGLSLMALLIVCLNVSGMMLIRGALRERELSIRQAIGASRVRLIRYLLSEALLLAGVGGALGMAVLFGTFRVLAWWIGRPLPPVLRPDFEIFASCAALCLVASLMFGLLPAVRFSHPALVSAMKDEAGVGGRRRVGRVHRLAAVVQVALVVPFLVLAGVALNQARTTASAGLGFDTEGLAAVRLDLTPLGDTEEARQESIRNIRGDLEQAAGILSVTVADGLPLDFRRRYVRVASQGAEFTSVHATRVGEDYLGTMGIRLLAGRTLTAEDRDGAPLVALVSQPLAGQLFPDGDALGQPLRLTPLGSPDEQELTIVGITADFVTSQVTTSRPQILLPLTQHSSPGVLVIVRGTTGTELAALPSFSFESAVRDIDPVFFRDRIVTGEGLVRNSVRDFLKQSSVAALPSAIVQALAALGVCGVIGFMVATRTREIAVRIALGASRRRVLVMVLTDVVKLVVPALAGGFLVTAALVRTTFFAFYPYTAMEPVIYAVAAGIAIVVALLAGLPAARRAASVEPMVAIRSE